MIFSYVIPAVVGREPPNSSVGGISLRHYGGHGAKYRRDDGL